MTRNKEKGIVPFSLFLVCNRKLHAVKLKCSGCGTVIENEFELSGFSRLSKELRGFEILSTQLNSDVGNIDDNRYIYIYTLKIARICFIISKTGV